MFFNILPAKWKIIRNANELQTFINQKLNTETKEKITNFNPSQEYIHNQSLLFFNKISKTPNTRLFAGYCNNEDNDVEYCLFSLHDNKYVRHHRFTFFNRTQTICMTTCEGFFVTEGSLKNSSTIIIDGDFFSEISRSTIANSQFSLFLFDVGGLLQVIIVVFDSAIIALKTKTRTKFENAKQSINSAIDKFNQFKFDLGELFENGEI